MIKQIQLRGISRTPSDRLSEDGGLSESLNMYMDTAENAPAIVPKDVTTDLGLPEALQADRIFIHKTANYENYIVVQEGRVVAYTPDVEDEEPLILLDLAEGEIVNDITSVGNTVVLAANKHTYYILYKENKYHLLGSQIPMPTIEFFDTRTTFRTPNKAYGSGDEYDSSRMYFFGPSVRESIIDDEKGVDIIAPFIPIFSDDVNGNIGLFDESVWGELDENKNNANEVIRRDIVEQIVEIKDKMIASNTKKGYFSYPIWALYAVRLYDGSLIISTPQLLSPGQESPIDIKGIGSPGFSLFYIRLNHYYKLGVRLHDFSNEIAEKWQDIVKGIDIYISEDINRLDFKNLTVGQSQVYGDPPYEGKYAKFIISGEEISFIHNALACSNFVRVEEFFIDRSFYGDKAKSLDVLREDYICDSTDYIKNEDRYSGRALLSNETYKTFEYNLLANALDTYNNSVIYSGVGKQYTSGPKWMAAQRYNNLVPLLIVYPFLTEATVADLPDWFWSKELIGNNTNQKYEFTFSWENVVVNGESNGSKTYATVNRYDDLWVYLHSLIFYPSSKFTLAQYAYFYEEDEKFQSSVKLDAHPVLPGISYFYDNKSLDGQPLVTSGLLPDANNTMFTNELIISKADNPLLYESTFAFQSKVVGVAIATTALSQGQFGQYPLYVFTEDGIWAMETAADGSFVSQKPLSREVCVNPASITSIDNAVIFVTDKAVMLIQGSEVVNISAFMNGKHYIPNDSARSIIAKQDGFGVYDSAISDETPFMSFMKKASIAYDYVGQRLICFAPGETFQYIYKIDTQTWHKTMFGEINLDTPINSYPECLVTSVDKVKDTASYLKTAIIPDYTTEQAEEQSNLIATDCANMDIYADTTPNLFQAENLHKFITGQIKEVRATGNVEGFVSTLNHFVYGINSTDKCVIDTEERYLSFAKVYNLSTVLDTTENQDAAKGILITRPFDLGMPDVFKSITSIKIRGDYDKGNVKFILQGSDNGREFYTLTSLRGKSWKMFRLFILADLEPTERISWIDIDFEPKFNNRLR